MVRTYTPPIWNDISEIIDLLGWMMLYSPRFIDQTGYFPGKNIQTTFYSLNESLRSVEGKLGTERYVQLIVMSDQMRAYFEADPENKTADTLKGRALITEMTDLLIQSIRASRQPSAS